MSSAAGEERDPDVKRPRAPRRRQTEVDEARHMANVLRADLASVREELQRLKSAIRRAQTATSLDVAHAVLDDALAPTAKVARARARVSSDRSNYTAPADDERDARGRLITFLRSELERALPPVLREEYEEHLTRATRDVLGRDATPLDELGLSARALSALRRVGIATVGDLANIRDDELAAIPYIGPQFLAEIRERVALHADG